MPLADSDVRLRVSHACSAGGCATGSAATSAGPGRVPVLVTASFNLLDSARDNRLQLPGLLRQLEASILVLVVKVKVIPVATLVPTQLGVNLNVRLQVRVSPTLLSQNITGPPGAGGWQLQVELEHCWHTHTLAHAPSQSGILWHI